MTSPQTGHHTCTTKDGPHPAQKVPAQDRKGQLTHVLNLLAHVLNLLAHVLNLLAHVLNLLTPKRNRTPLPNDVPSLHRAKKTPRKPHMKSGKDDEDTIH